VTTVDILDIVVRVRDAATAGLAKAQLGIRGITSSALGGKAAMIGLGAGLAVFAAGALTIKKSVSAWGEYEQAMANVSTLMDEGQHALAVYGDEVSRLATTLPVAGGQLEVASGLYQTISAGITDAAEATAFLEVAMKGAVGGMTDTRTMVDGLTTVINAYGMEAGEAEAVSDIFFTTIKRGKTTAEELAPALSRVISTASAAKVGFTEVAAALATMTKQGLNTSEAVTALNRLMMEFLKPNEELRAAIVETALATGVTLPVKVRDAIQAFSEQELALQSLQDEYAETSEEVNGLGDAMDDMSDQMAANRLNIKEIRFAARRDGRELTESELNDIDRLEIANDGLSISYDHMKLKQDELNETGKELEASMKTQEAATAAASAELDKQAPIIGATMLAEQGLIGMLELLEGLTQGNAGETAIYTKNVRGLKGALTLTGDGLKMFKEDLVEMTDATGASEAAFTKAADTQSSDVARMKNKFTELLTQIGEDLSPIFTETLIPAMEGIGTWVDEHGDEISTWATDVKDALVFAFDLISLAVDTATKAMDDFNNAIEALRDIPGIGQLIQAHEVGMAVEDLPRKLTSELLKEIIRRKKVEEERAGYEYSEYGTPEAVQEELTQPLGYAPNFPTIPEEEYQLGGTVPHDMIAKVHEGETIISAGAPSAIPSEAALELAGENGLPGLAGEPGESGQPPAMPKIVTVTEPSEGPTTITIYNTFGDINSRADADYMLEIMEERIPEAIHASPLVR